MPLAVAAIVLAASVMAKMTQVETSAGSGARNPLVPAFYDVWSVSVAFLLVPIGAAWLLWRLRRRGVPQR